MLLPDRNCKTLCLRHLMIRLEETVTTTLHRSHKMNSFQRHNITNLRSYYIFVTLSTFVMSL